MSASHLFHGIVLLLGPDGIRLPDGFPETAHIGPDASLKAFAVTQREAFYSASSCGWVQPVTQGKRYIDVVA
jgi:hypothetical protein